MRGLRARATTSCALVSRYIHQCMYDYCWSHCASVCASLIGNSAVDVGRMASESTCVGFRHFGAKSTSKLKACQALLLSHPTRLASHSFSRQCLGMRENEPLGRLSRRLLPSRHLQPYLCSTTRPEGCTGYHIALYIQDKETS